VIEFNRPGESSLSLDMAPMIDIVFQLLIFFMLSSSFLYPAMKIALPKTVESDAKEQERIVVSVDREGNVFVNAAKSSMSQLKSDLEAKLAADPKRSVHIRGDKEMPYRYFVEVMGSARQAGARQVNILHEKDQP